MKPLLDLSQSSIEEVIEMITGKRPQNPNPILFQELDEYRSRKCGCDRPQRFGKLLPECSTKGPFLVRCHSCFGFFDASTQRFDASAMTQEDFRKLSAAIDTLDRMAYKDFCSCWKRTIPNGKYELGEILYCQTCGRRLGRVSIDTQA